MRYGKIVAVAISLAMAAAVLTPCEVGAGVIEDAIKEAAKEVIKEEAEKIIDQAKEDAAERVTDEVEQKANEQVENNYTNPSDMKDLTDAAGNVIKGLVTKSESDAVKAYKTYVSTYPNAAPADLKVVGQTIDTVSISFTTVPDAQLYYIKYWATGSAAVYDCYAVDEEAAKTGVTKTKSVYATLYNLVNGEYTFQVIAANYSSAGSIKKATDLSSQKDLYSSIKTATEPAKPLAVSVDRLDMDADGSGHISVSISGLNSNSDNAYISQAVVYNYKGNKLLTFTGSATGAAKTSPKLENNRFYSIKVRGVYKRGDGEKVYGAWSDTVYTKGAFEYVTYSRKKGKVTVKWDRFFGADKYIIYISEKRNSGYKKAASVKADVRKCVVDKYKDKALKTGKTYYFKIKALKTVDSEKIESVSSPKKITITD